VLVLQRGLLRLGPLEILGVVRRRVGPVAGPLLRDDLHAQVERGGHEVLDGAHLVTG
jgi:hypothetical protein